MAEQVDWIKLIEENGWSVSPPAYRSQEWVIHGMDGTICAKKIGSAPTLIAALEQAVLRANVKFSFACNEEDKFDIVGRGTCYPVENPVQCDDFDHLIGATVEINDKLHVVKGVERFCHSPPWKQGEAIALMVEDGTAT